MTDVTSPTPTALQAVAPEGVPSQTAISAMIALAAAGAVATVLLMTVVGYPEGYPGIDEMKDTSQWVIWVLVLAIQVATWFGLAWPVIQSSSKSTAAWSPNLIAYAVVVLFLLSLPFSSAFFFERAHPVQEALAPRLTLFAVLGSAFGFVAAVGVGRTRAQIEGMTFSTPPTEQDVNEYLEVRRRLVFLGSVLALTVALAVLATGGLRNTVVAMETGRATEATSAAAVAADAEKNDHLTAAAEATARAARFGTDLVMAYGLYFSFLLILIYLPAYLTLLAQGRRLRDEIKPGALPTDASYEDTKRVRDELDGILQLKLGYAESLKAATLILIPLLTSLGSTLLGGVEITG